MQLRQLWLHDFRNFAEAQLELGDGLTAVVGANGEGKSNLLESVAYLATLRSFRGAPTEAMVRSGCSAAVIRAETEREGRSILIEAEINPQGRNRALVNRQKLRRARDLLGSLVVTVFAPDDLFLVKGGPAQRREFLDDLMVSLAPRNDGLRLELEKVLRQRNTLLRQAGGQATADVISTLEVWDTKLAEVGETIAGLRSHMVEQLAPLVMAGYQDLAGAGAAVELAYEPSWGPVPLSEALAEGREQDLRRGVTTAGPHRDDMAVSLAGMAARTHASQGEQRSLALALRLASHELVTAQAGSAPVLLLDDVFSELDETRSAALVERMPPGQALLTTAGPLPAASRPQTVLRVEAGSLRGG